MGTEAVRLLAYDPAVDIAGLDRSGLRAVCGSVRLALGAAAVSVAVVVDDGLHYLASDGSGADEITDVVLPPGRGIAGYVAATGQSLAVSDVTRDPRFDREVAERTGYVPRDLLVVPVTDAGGEAIGVLSVLDRAAEPPVSGADALRLASTYATIAGHLLDGPSGAPGDAELAGLVERLGRLDGPGRSAVAAAVVALLDALEP